MCIGWLPESIFFVSCKKDGQRISSSMSKNVYPIFPSQRAIQPGEVLYMLLGVVQIKKGCYFPSITYCTQNSNWKQRPYPKIKKNNNHEVETNIYLIWRNSLVPQGNRVTWYLCIWLNGNVGSCFKWVSASVSPPLRNGLKQFLFCFVCFPPIVKE